MTTVLLKYKHYLLLLLALILANYFLIPLTELQNEQQQKLSLLQKKQEKTHELIASRDNFSSENKQLTHYLKLANSYLFIQKNEADFKLKAQTQIEAMLQKSGCAISRIGFKGKQQISPAIQKWYMEIRYEGDVNCLVNTTRSVETAKPYINIEEYSYRTNKFDKRAQAEFTAMLKVSVWFKTNADNNNSTKG